MSPSPKGSYAASAAAVVDLDPNWYDPNQNKKGGPMNVKVPEIDTLLERDGYLRLHEREIRRR